jgi:hypothetical protein
MALASGGLPARKGPRPITTARPLHIQHRQPAARVFFRIGAPNVAPHECNGLGDPKYLNRLLNGRGADVLSVSFAGRPFVMASGSLCHSAFGAARMRYRIVRPQIEGVLAFCESDTRR